MKKALDSLSLGQREVLIDGTERQPSRRQQFPNAIAKARSRAPYHEPQESRIVET